LNGPVANEEIVEKLYNVRGRRNWGKSDRIEDTERHEFQRGRRRLKFVGAAPGRERRAVPGGRIRKGKAPMAEGSAEEPRKSLFRPHRRAVSRRAEHFGREP